jgi:hypothetical protein
VCLCAPEGVIYGGHAAFNAANTPTRGRAHDRICPPNLRFWLANAVLFGAVATSSSPALATDCPVGWGTPATNCDGICSSSGDTWTCDVSSATTGARVVMVSDHDTIHDYEAWGDVDGDKFCCAIDEGSDPVIDTFEIIGSDHQDTLGFSGNSKANNLKAISSNPITATISAGDGDDTIFGSDYDGTDYQETLEGEGDGDTIFGYDGDDILDGGSGNDNMLGGDGDDMMYGGTGDDTMGGGYGVDTMDGEAHNDPMSGDAGPDTMYGGTGDDNMSGGGDDDYLNGEDGADEICGDGHGSGDTLDDGGADGDIDYLWGATNVDTEYCGEGSTYWSGFATTGGCAGNPTLTAPPPGCP